MDIRDFVKDARKAVESVKGIGDDMTLSEAKLVRCNAETAWRNFIDVVEERLGDFAIKLYGAYSLTDWTVLPSLVHGFPYGGKDLDEILSRVESVCTSLKSVDLNITSIDVVCGPEMLQIREEHGVYIAIPIEFLEDGFDPKNSELVSSEMETSKLVEEYMITFGSICGGSPVRPSAARVMRILHKYPNCLKELQKTW